MKTIQTGTRTGRRAAVAAALFVACLALGPALWAAGTPLVTVADQAVRDGTVTIAQVVSNGPGWIVIHADANGGPGPVTGYAAVKDGVNVNVVVKIDTAKATPVLYAMLHTDAGTVGTYEFPGADKPVMVDGKMVSPPFSSTALGISASAPAVDGVVNQGEYAYSKDFGALALSASRTADSLFLAVVGKTAGWVAVGIGAQKMDGATIFIGFVDKDGKVQLKPQVGQGHTHKDTTQDVASTVSASAMKETGGATTLELALKSDAYVAKGQDSLDLIVAVGPDDSFSPRHTFRAPLSIKLAR
jgi:hypothetical protein